MDPLFPTIFNWAEASDDELREFVAAAAEVAEQIGADPDSFVTDERPKAALLAEMKEGVAALEEARAELATRSEEEPEGEGDEPDPDAEIADLAAFAARAEAEEPEPEGDEPEGDEPEPEAEAAADTGPVEPEPVIAAAPPVAPPARALLPRPARSRRAAPQEARPPVCLTAAAAAQGYAVGEEIDAEEVARAMIRRRNDFGIIADGTRGEKLPIARLGWDYPEDRRLAGDHVQNMALIDALTNPEKIKAEFRARREGALTASGGLCAPVTPYYNLQMVSVADRPVRGALPGFNADRGGVRVAAPASLASVTTGVGIRTVAEDYAGGTEGAKTCQVIDCPAFEECDVDIIFHCLQFGNLGARAFPELVEQWTNLVIASQARTAETNLLDGIAAASTAVTAATIGLGAAATYLGEILVAAAAMRNRHRMDPDTVLRLLAPRWLLDMLVSDTIRTQFQRFDMDAAAFIAQLREGNVEPTFYLDGATGAGQVFGAQAAGALLTFPATTVSYLYPEGSFLFLDGGTLELGLVRDSVLNASNDFQLFGESFEGICFVGVESYAITSSICDSGTVTLPVAVTCPLDYSA